MILVTGATGFVGRALVPRLADMGADIRCLIRPSGSNPRLPRGVPVQVAVSSVTDFRGVRAALVGVDTVVHLAGAEWSGSQAALMRVDYEGSRKLLEAAAQAGVTRFVYVSHLGADRASAYGVQKVKGLIEEFIRKSGIPYLILRSALLYGEEDSFTNALAMALHILPGLFIMPGDGEVRLQPLWVEDLVTCLEWSIDDSSYYNQMYSIGGPEFLTFNQIVDHVMEHTGSHRAKVSVATPYLRLGMRALETVLPRSPVSSRWLEYLAVNRTCELHSVTRFFGVKPARFEHMTGYLEHRNWREELIRHMMGGRKK